MENKCLLSMWNMTNCPIFNESFSLSIQISTMFPINLCLCPFMTYHCDSPQLVSLPLAGTCYGENRRVRKLDYFWPFSCFCRLFLLKQWDKIFYGFLTHSQTFLILEVIGVRMDQWKAKGIKAIDMVRYGWYAQINRYQENM